MDRIRIMASLVILATFTISVAFAADPEKDSGMNCDMFNKDLNPRYTTRVLMKDLSR